MTTSTVVHAFSFNLHNEDDARAYRVLREAWKADGHPRKMRSLASREGHHSLGSRLDGRTVALETEWLFANQWNTAPIEGLSKEGYRVFDWAEDACFNNGVELVHLRYGYYLEQTEEMREIRNRRHACGYCGNQTDGKLTEFCTRCIDSAYLKEGDLLLLRMRPVSTPFDTARVPLSEAEAAELLPRYRKAQIHGDTERGRLRMEKARRDVAEGYARAVHVATTKRDGLTWLMDAGIQTENVIYYSHTDRFAFGWRRKLSDAEASELLNIISEFPFAYTLEGETRKYES